MKIKHLYDSRGHHIANLLNDQLHSPRGHNIGHHLKPQNIFIDMRGRYLGEIVNGDRLLANGQSPHKHANYGNYGNYGNIGNYGNPGMIGSMSLPLGYQDIDPSQLGE
jgi:hypothetical protein